MVCESQHFFSRLLTFWPNFLLFSWGFLALKNVDVYSIFGRGEGSQKVYGLYTHENVDIYGWLLSLLKIHKLFITINKHLVVLCLLKYLLIFIFWQIHYQKSQNRTLTDTKPFL